MPTTRSRKDTSMISDEERRKFAENLRCIAQHPPEWATSACAIAEVFDANYPLWKDSGELFDMLADLIELRPVDGETSDGYHTFNELYHHRAVLFSVIVNRFSEAAWKSKMHHDGSMYDGMFIVGIDTPEGQATYHYDIDPYYDMFRCAELERAPEWDGHTPDQAIERIGKLGDETTTNLDLTDTTTTTHGETVYHRECRRCGRSCEEMYGNYDYCPHCRMKVVEP